MVIPVSGSDQQTALASQPTIVRSPRACTVTAIRANVATIDPANYTTITLLVNDVLVSTIVVPSGSETSPKSIVDLSIAEYDKLSANILGTSDALGLELTLVGNI